MREILFRGKRIDNKEWIEGMAFPHDNDRVTIFIQHSVDGVLTGEEVDPETVGQFTGLTDKNGKKIFEGDIIEHEGNRYSINYLPYYARFSAVKPNNVFCVFAYQCGEVIGNIYDNSELLGGADMNELDKVSKLGELVEQLGQCTDSMIDRIYDEVNNAIDCIHNFCRARKGRCIDCPAYITLRIESGDTVQTCKFRCDAPVNWEHIDVGGADNETN